jgi:hypothetical protein
VCDACFARDTGALWEHRRHSAAGAAGLGVRVALVEKALLGGTA